MSRELDAQVAEKVMGWKDADGNWNAKWCEGFRPSTSIEAAWEVVEKFEDWSITKFCKEELDEDVPKQYLIAVQRGGTWHDAYGDTASEAICLAALKSVGAP